MSIVNSRAGAHRNGDGRYLNCPRCGLSIVPRAEWLGVEHCPRCLARCRTVVELFASRLPTEELYERGLAPCAAHRTGDHTRRDR
jgi:hypothetical protein